MTTLYLDHRNLELTQRGQSLRIYQDGHFQRSIPLDLISHIVCRASVALSSSLMTNLAHAGIGMTLFGGRHGQQSSHLGISGTQDVTRRLGQYRLYMEPEQRVAWCCRLVAHKILRQIRLLQQARQQRPDLRLDISRSLTPLRGQLQQLKHAPPTQIDSLRGIEGSAARLYFSAYACLFPDSLNFHGRQRRPPPDPVNALLSLSYTLLHGDVQQALASVGLDPWLGIYHEPAHGRASLVCDLVEPFRPRVDAFVWQLIRERSLRHHHFSLEHNGCLLNKEGRAIFYPSYETHIRCLTPLLRRVAMRLAEDMARRQSTTIQTACTDSEEIAFTQPITSDQS